MNEKTYHTQGKNLFYILNELGYKKVTKVIIKIFSVVELICELMFLICVVKWNKISTGEEGVFLFPFTFIHLTHFIQQEMSTGVL